MTTRQQISDWFDKPYIADATHMIIVCDTYDWEDYPVYVRPDEDARTIMANNHGVNMQKVMEVYNLGLPKEAQMDERRAFNY